MNRSDHALPIVRCGVEISPPSPRVMDHRRESLEDRTPIHILSVGRLVRKKGMDILLRALASLPSTAPDWCCTIVGDGPEREPLHQLHASLELGERVKFAGALANEDVLEMLDSCDLFVLPCRIDSTGDRDGIPVALMEAMARGICTVSGDLPAVRELIEPDVSGLLAPPDDAGSLAAILRQLLEDAGLRERLGENARRRVEAEFELHLNAQRLLNAFTACGAVPASPAENCADRVGRAA